ncbi:MAG: sigma-70 family RNA polymerase sigma factor [Bacteroidia bacterium]|nr:sigma-70 family RNA polymerase sigma factor [Bacteroidia bacterium]
MKEPKGIDQNEVWNNFILNGDLYALSNIYLHYYDLLFDYGQRHTSDKQLVEDTIQNVFINIIKFRKSISIVKNLNGYLISTFRRQLFLDLNKKKKTILTEQLPEEHFDYFKSPDQDVSDEENLGRLHLTIKQCIDKLTDKQQEIIFLRFEREISYEEIAETLNISVDSCYKSIHRAIKTVRSEAEKILEKRGNIFLCIWFRSAY